MWKCPSCFKEVSPFRPVRRAGSPGSWNLTRVSPASSMTTMCLAQSTKSERLGMALASTRRRGSQHNFRALLTDHDGGRIGVSARQSRHDSSVVHAQALETVYPQ